jgi:hypothetical protein
MDAGTGGSAFNVYLAGKTLANGGYGYITLKYDGRQVTAFANKPLSWQQNLPFYFGIGAGDDVPRGLAVEYKPALNQSGQTRRIWATGNSWHINSLDDWATQFIVEQLP